jgi:SsrA-binding protein
MSASTIIKNKKAYFDYVITDKTEAGIALRGSEVKAIRDGKASLVDSYVRIKNKEAFIVNAYIAPYSFTQDDAYDSRRTRKLLLHKHEIVQLETKLNQKGFTIVPLRLHFKRGRVKVEIGLGKGKKTFDKRQSIKKKMQQREIQRQIKG